MYVKQLKNEKLHPLSSFTFPPFTYILKLQKSSVPNATSSIQPLQPPPRLLLHLWPGFILRKRSRITLHSGGLSIYIFISASTIIYNIIVNSLHPIEIGIFISVYLHTNLILFISASIMLCRLSGTKMVLET